MFLQTKLSSAVWSRRHCTAPRTQQRTSHYVVSEPTSKAEARSGRIASRRRRCKKSDVIDRRQRHKQQQQQQLEEPRLHDCQLNMAIVFLINFRKRNDVAKI